MHSEHQRLPRVVANTVNPQAFVQNLKATEMGERRKSTLWPQTGKMTDVEVKCHDMEANMAVRIVYKENLKRSPLNWLVNRRRRKRYFSQRMLAARHFQAIYVAACKGQKTKGENSKDAPNFSKAEISEVNVAQGSSARVTFWVLMPPCVLK